MSDLPMLSGAQIRWIVTYFPLSHGEPRVDDRRVLSRILYVIKTGLLWCDTPSGYGPQKTLYSRSVRWSNLGVFSQIFAALVKQAGEPKVLMIDTTLLKTLKTASSLFIKGLYPDVWADQTWLELQTTPRLRWRGQACSVVPD